MVSYFITYKSNSLYVVMNMLNILIYEFNRYKDGQLIIASERIKFTELEDGRFQITIERVTLEDTGSYSVVASNAIGQMSEFWKLV